LIRSTKCHPNRRHRSIKRALTNPRSANSVTSHPLGSAVATPVVISSTISQKSHGHGVCCGTTRPARGKARLCGTTPSTTTLKAFRCGVRSSTSSTSRPRSSAKSTGRSTAQIPSTSTPSFAIHRRNVRSMLASVIPSATTDATLASETLPETSIPPTSIASVCVLRTKISGKSVRNCAFNLGNNRRRAAMLSSVT